MDIIQTIQNQIDKEISSLEPHLQKWVKENLITPTIVEMLPDLNKNQTKRLWVLTSEDGANYQITYDPESHLYGLGMLREDGRSWYMGPYGSFRETIENM